MRSGLLRQGLKKRPLGRDVLGLEVRMDDATDAVEVVKTDERVQRDLVQEEYQVWATEKV